MQVSVMTNKISRILFMMLWCRLHRESHMTVLMCLLHQHQSKKQVLGNQCVYSPTYWMLKRKQQNVVLELHNTNSDIWKWVISCGPKKQN